MSHIVNDCPLSRFRGGLTTLHLAGDEAVKGLGHALHTIRRRMNETRMEGWDERTDGRMDRWVQVRHSRGPPFPGSTITLCTET